MLTRNDVKYHPSEKELEHLKAHNVFMLASKMIKKNPHPKNKNRIDAPRSFSFDSIYNIVDKKGNSVTIRYYENKKERRSAAGVFPEYLPASIAFPQSTQIVVPRRNVDLFYFLYHHPRNANSPYRDKTRSPWFYLEDKAADAKGKANKAKTLQKALEKIWGSQHGLTKDEALSILKSHNFPKADQLTDDEVRMKLDPIARKDPEGFIRGTGGASMKIRTAIQEAIDEEVIKHSTRQKGWFYTTPDGTLAGLLTGVAPAHDPFEKLTEFLMGIDQNDNLSVIVAETERKRRSKSEFVCPEPGCDFVAKNEFGLQSHSKKHKNAVTNSSITEPIKDLL